MKQISLLFLLLFSMVGLTARGERFVVLNDIHVEPGNQTDSVLRVAVAEINAMEGIDAVVVNGDLTNEGSDVQLENVKGILDGLRHRLYVVPGNHENNWSQSATRTFPRLWGDDRFVFETDSLVVVGLNCGPYMKMGDGHVKSEDLLWLRETLQSRTASGKKVLSFNHFALNEDLDSYLTYDNLLNKFPVILHVSGHYHRFDTYQTLGSGIKGLILPALDLRDGTYGYSLLEVSPERVDVYQKRVGGERKRLAGIEIELPKPFDSELTVSATYPNPAFGTEDFPSEHSSIFTRLGLDGERLYYGTSTGDVKAFDRKTKELLWSYKTGGSLFSRPVSTGDRLYVPTTDGELLILEAATGKLIERQAAKGPYVADGTVYEGIYYQGGDKTMEARDAATGRLIWSFDSIANYCQAAPAVEGDDLVFGAWDTNLYCLDRQTGRLKWKWNNCRKGNLYSPGNVVPVLLEDRVIIVAPDRYMTCLDRRTGREIWRDNSVKYRESLGRSGDGKTVYAKTMDGEMVAVDATAETYTHRWLSNPVLGYDHAPCIVLEDKDIVFMGSRNGRVAAVERETGKVLDVQRFGSSEVNGFDVAPDGAVYASMVDGRVIQIRR